jgi:arylsulfatase A-like enzyme
MYLGISDEKIKKNWLNRLMKLELQKVYPTYPLGWAQAANVPFKNWKQDAHSEGGTHNPLIVYYPKGIKTPGIRTNTVT